MSCAGLVASVGVPPWNDFPCLSCAWAFSNVLHLIPGCSPANAGIAKYEQFSNFKVVERYLFPIWLGIVPPLFLIMEVKKQVRRVSLSVPAYPGRVYREPSPALCASFLSQAAEKKIAYITFERVATWIISPLALTKYVACQRSDWLPF